jgi:hypothetical protein
MSYAFPFRKLLDEYFGTMDIEFIEKPNDFPLPSCGLMVFGFNNVFATSEELDTHQILVKLWLATEEVWPEDYHMSGTKWKTRRSHASIGAYFVNPEKYTMMKLKYG